jgi:hypothetical protein
VPANILMPPIWRWIAAPAAAGCAWAWCAFVFIPKIVSWFTESSKQNCDTGSLINYPFAMTSVPVKKQIWALMYKYYTKAMCEIQ